MTTKTTEQLINIIQRATDQHTSTDSIKIDLRGMGYTRQDVLDAIDAITDGQYDYDDSRDSAYVDAWSTDEDGDRLYVLCDVIIEHRGHLAT